MRRLPLTMMKAVGTQKYNDWQDSWATQYPKMAKKPSDRVNGNEVIRRYPNGTVDHLTTAEKAVRLLVYHNQGMVPLYPSDAALLVLVLPKQFGHLMDSSIAKTYCRQISDEDVKKIQDIIKNSFADGDDIKT